MKGVDTGESVGIFPPPKSATTCGDNGDGSKSFRPVDNGETIHMIRRPEPSKTKVADATEVEISSVQKLFDK